MKPKQLRPTCLPACREALDAVDEYVAALKPFTIETDMGFKIVDFFAHINMPPIFKKVQTAIGSLQMHLLDVFGTRIDENPESVGAKSYSYSMRDDGVDSSLQSAIILVVEALHEPPEWAFGKIVEAERIKKTEAALGMLRRHAVTFHEQRITEDAALAPEAMKAGEKQPFGLTKASDFSWVKWADTIYTFKKGNQAETIRCLWEEYERSGHQNGCGLSEKTIAEKLGASEDNFTIRHTFRNHSAFKTILRRVGRGQWALWFEAEPESR